DRLGHRREAEGGVASHRLLRRQILDAVRVEVDDLAVPPDERRDVGQRALLDKRTHRLLECLEAMRRGRDRFRGREVAVSPQACDAKESDDAESDDAKSDDRDTSFHVSLRYEPNIIVNLGRSL